MASLGELLGEYLFGMPQDAEVVEGTRGNVLPGAKYRLPDGTERWGVAAPQGLADALLGLGAASGRVQDPNAPQGYVSQETLRRGGEGLAGSATLGSFATRAPAGALRAGLSRKAIDDITGLPLDENGMVTLYHATKTPEAANAIRQNGLLKSQAEPDVYLSTAKEGTGYGDHVVAVKVDPRRLELDDEFPDGRMDFRINTGRPGGSTKIDLAANSRNSQAAGLAMELARNKGRDLDPSQAARMARAREMGFGDEVFYHGTTQDVSPGFDPARFGSNTGARDAGLGVYMTDKPAATKFFGGYGESMNPKYAEFLDRTKGMRNEYEIGEITRELFGRDAIDYHNKQRPKMSYETVMGWEDGANVMPLRVRGDLKEIDGTTYNPQAFEKAIQEAKAEGWSGVRIKGIKDDFEAPVRHDQVVVFDPSNIRSVNAMFDPSKSHSANLLAANPLAGAVPLTMPAPGPQGPTLGEVQGRPIPPEEEAQRQALIRYLEGGR